MANHEQHSHRLRQVDKKVMEKTFGRDTRESTQWSICETCFFIHEDVRMDIHEIMRRKRGKM